jgi:hypoxanthine phosphoribosyltransferase
MRTSVELDFMAVSSYGKGTVSTGDMQIKKDLATDIAGRDVLIVEDIIDSGNTLYNLKKLLNTRSPSSVNIVTLLDKPQRREVPMEPEYTCFVIEDEFVVGYGMDYAEEYRNLPYIGVLKRSVYEK